MARLWQAMGLVLLIVVLVGGWLTYLYLRPQPGEVIAGSLALARLAELPATIANKQLSLEGKPFVSDVFMRFGADKNSITQWIAQSPALARATPQHFDSDHRYLPDPGSAAAQQKLRAQGHTMYPVLLRSPQWWFPSVEHSGRRFELAPSEQLRDGEVIVNDATGTVYIRIGIRAPSSDKGTEG